MINLIIFFLQKDDDIMIRFLAELGIGIYSDYLL